MGLLGELDAATNHVRSGNAGAAGAPELEAALSNVMSRFSTGIEQIHSSLQQLQARLAAAAAAYEGTDAEVRSGFGG
jgi:uncharacterized protein YukE